MKDGSAPPQFADLDPSVGTRVAKDVVYAHAPQAGGQVALAVTLYLPAPGSRPAPVLVWTPPAGARAAARGGVLVRRLARQLTSQGFALAAPRFRPGATEADLTPATRARMAALALLPVAPGAEALAGPAAAAAAEDGARFLAWLVARQAALGLTGRPVLGGCAGGAASAFGLVFLAPHLGLDRPDPGGVLSYSGGLPARALPARALSGLRAAQPLRYRPADRIRPGALPGRSGAGAGRGVAARARRPAGPSRGTASGDLRTHPGAAARPVGCCRAGAGRGRGRAGMKIAPSGALMLSSGLSSA
ncbi:MAG: hypothetical protein M5U35_07450 [Roseovarius sp.]|nr:hypothetical protein [Roseovarius sp.]